MPYDYWTTEVYKFAAGQLNRGFSGMLGPSPESSSPVLLVAISRKLIGLLDNIDDADAPRLKSTLDALVTSVEEEARNKKGEDADPNFQIGQRLADHGEGGKKIPFYSAAIHFYAGRRLESFIDERIADGSANKEWYDFCKTLKEKIALFLGMFLDGYGPAKAGSVCDVCRIIYSDITPTFRGIIPDLNSAIQRMERYLTQKAPAQ